MLALFRRPKCRACGHRRIGRYCASCGTRLAPPAVVREITTMGDITDERRRFIVPMELAPSGGDIFGLLDVPKLGDKHPSRLYYYVEEIQSRTFDRTSWEVVVKYAFK